MINLFRRKKVTFLDNYWSVIKADVRVSNVPNVGELIYNTEEGKYFEVIKVIYNLTNNKCQDIFVIIETYAGELKNN
jgi:hypothetical protein